MTSSKPFTGLGDDGETGLLGGGRYKKSELRFEVMGSIEELSAILGILKNAIASESIQSEITSLQKNLYKLMADLASPELERATKRNITNSDIHDLERMTDGLNQEVKLPAGFILPGDTAQSALADFCRTVARRVERRIVALDAEQGINNPDILPYINRLSSYLYILELYLIENQDKSAPTMANE